jgi:hypothetical protein
MHLPKEGLHGQSLLTLVLSYYVLSTREIIIILRKYWRMAGAFHYPMIAGLPALFQSHLLISILAVLKI